MQSFPLPQLVSLTPSHGASLERFLSEFDDRRDELHGYFCDRHLSVAEVSETLKAWEVGERLPEGWVECTTRFWRHEDDLQGVINIRHQLNPHLKEVGGHIGYCVAPSARRRGVATEMLRAALLVCSGLGIQRVLITCDAENLASLKTIERCGGVLEREGWSELAKKLQRWYWVEL